MKIVITVTGLEKELLLIEAVLILVLSALIYTSFFVLVNTLMRIYVYR